MTAFDRKVGSAEFRRVRDRFTRWGRWGDDDELGALNLVTPERVAAAAALVRKGKVISLATPIVDGGQVRPIPTRFRPVHTMTRSGGDVAAAYQAGRQGFLFTDDMIVMPLQTGSHWDALSHVFCDGRMYNGRGTADVPATGAARNGITVAANRMAGRGVLLDVPALTGRPWLEIGESVEAEDLQACCERQGVTIGPGDFVLVRTGRIGAAKASGEWGPEFSGGPGSGLGFSTIEYLCERDIAALATDTFSVEILPSQTIEEAERSPLHVIMVQGAGVHLGELWDLEELAADCADDGVYEFLLVAAPMAVEGAVGAPVNPQAVK
jgi:kynurenine formamidase